MSGEREARAWREREGFGAAPSAPVLAVANTPGQDYEAFAAAKGARPARRIWLHLRNGERHMLEAYPLRVKMPNSRMMMVVTRTDVISLCGHGLDQLAPLLSDMRLLAITEFNPALHRQPDPDAPRVDQIDITEMREMP